MQTYSKHEIAFAWLSIAIGYTFCRVFPAALTPMGALLFILLLFIVTTVVLSIRKIRFDILPVTVALSAIVMAFSLIFNSNPFIRWFAYMYSLMAYLYYIYAACGNRCTRGVTDWLVIDFLKALFVSPALSFAELYKTLISNCSRINGKLIVKILLGIAVAVFPSAVICVLLSYDSDFVQLIETIYNSIGFYEIFSHLGSFILGVPVAIFVYGAFYSSAYKKSRDRITADDCRRVSALMRVAPSVTVVSAVVPVLLIYVLFFISQWKYYVSGFVGVLPDQISYAQYAREGFFQLCTVAVINLVILIAVSLFIKRTQGKASAVQRILSVIISVFTLVLIATAIAKMVMYIDCFGLTPRRVYASWLMVVIAFVFVIVILRQFVQKLPVVALSFVTLIAAFMLISFANTDGVIANYNVDGYIDGKYESVDLDLLTHLGDSSASALARYAEHCEHLYGEYSYEYTEATEALYDVCRNAKGGIFSFTLPRQTALDVAETLGIE